MSVPTHIHAHSVFIGPNLSLIGNAWAAYLTNLHFALTIFAFIEQLLHFYWSNGNDCNNNYGGGLLPRKVRKRIVTNS